MIEDASHDMPNEYNISPSLAQGGLNFSVHTIPADAILADMLKNAALTKLSKHLRQEQDCSNLCNTQGAKR